MDASTSAQALPLYVLIADEAVAKLMALPAPGAELAEVHVMTDPEAHTREAAMHRDAHGRRHGGDGSGVRSSGHATTSAGDSDRHLEAERFAKRVAEDLVRRFRAKQFDRLRLVAAPRFLGLLRRQLDSAVAAVVEDEQAKDLSHLDAAALTAHLFPEAGRAGAP